MCPGWLFLAAISWHSCPALQRVCSHTALIWNCSRSVLFRPLVLVLPSVSYSVYFLKLILVVVHYEVGEVNPCKEIRGERSHCKVLMFPELCMWFFITFQSYLLGLCLWTELLICLLGGRMSCCFWTWLCHGWSQLKQGWEEDRWWLQEGLDCAMGFCVPLLGEATALLCPSGLL